MASVGVAAAPRPLDATQEQMASRDRMQVSPGRGCGSPLPFLDPDHRSIYRKPWDQVEKALDARDASIVAVSGYGLEPDGDDQQFPPLDREFMLFERPQACTLKTWSHTCLSYSVCDHVATLTLSAPQRENAFDEAMLDALQDAVMDLHNHADVSFLVIKAHGDIFSCGFGRGHAIREADMDDSSILSFHKQFAFILQFWRRLPQYTLALVQGPVYGAALGLVSVCDSVFAAKSAVFSMDEIKRGAVPATSIPYIATRFTYIKHASQLLLLGQSLAADEAEQQGFVNKVVDNTEFLTLAADELFGKMSRLAPGRCAALKAAVLEESDRIKMGVQ